MHFFPRKHLLIGSSIFSQKNTNQEAKKTVKQTKLNTTAVKKMRYNKKRSFIFTSASKQVYDFQIGT